MTECKCGAQAVTASAESIGILIYNNDTDQLEITFYEIEGEAREGDEVYVVPPPAPASGGVSEEVIQKACDAVATAGILNYEAEIIAIQQAIRAALTQPAGEMK